MPPVRRSPGRSGPAVSSGKLSFLSFVTLLTRMRCCKHYTRSVLIGMGGDGGWVSGARRHIHHGASVTFIKRRFRKRRFPKPSAVSFFETFGGLFFRNLRFSKPSFFETIEAFVFRNGRNLRFSKPSFFCRNLRFLGCVAHSRDQDCSGSLIPHLVL